MPLSCKAVAVLMLGSLASAAISMQGRALAAEAGACSSDQRASYVCDVQNVEDLVAIRNSPWVLAGRITDPPTEGGFYLIDARNASARPLTPNFSSPRAEDFSDCPGALGADQFAAHGIGIRYGSGSKHEVYAVNHNARESIEIFDLDMSSTEPKLTWKGCVVVPPEVMPNSVAPLPEGGMVVTSFGIRTDPETYQKAMKGGISGLVMRWSPQSGWSEIPGTRFSANNGIAVSNDGKRLFVTGWGDRKLHVISLDVTPHTHRAIDLGAMHPDNIRTTEEGKLLITGQTGTPAEIFACTREPSCEVGFKVLSVDPASLAVETLLDEPGSAAFGGASTAILVGEEAWVGTFNGSRVARYRLER